ncbi:MAG TPA: ABC transporter ATP-binding protein/permease [Xanthobacteraceae bacterium]|nr:ABC transporter ATP-binding protein/permease [Xanthobacteraceae bacterium]
MLAKSFVSALVTIWRLAVPYFRSEDRWPGRVLLAAVVATELGQVGINVLLNEWNNRFYNALQDRNWDNFVSELLYFCVLAVLYILAAVYQLYLNQWLQIRWRRWMTVKFLGEWLTGSNHYRMQLLGDVADNPDQRIADDLQIFVDRTLSIGIGMLSSIVTLGSFVVILWNLSADAPLILFGGEWRIPGYLVWAALLYAVFGTVFAHLIGRPLIELTFYQQRYEADFRFNLVRVRENSEQIALLAGEEAEDSRLLARFAHVVENWRAIMTRQKRLTFFTAGYNQVSNVFPFLVVSPVYFAGRMALGGMMQTASAFSSVQTALSFFVTSYRTIAEWRAVVDRLSGFETAIVAARAVTEAPPHITVTPQPSREVAMNELEVRLPDGTPLVAVAAEHFTEGRNVLVNGQSGAGKSTLFRAIAGIWPFGSGRISVPRGARVMLLPQRPYLPIGSLLAAVSYPAPPDRFGAPAVAAALAAVGLDKLVPRLSEEAHWNRMLSLGEQQRVAIARALLIAPDYLFLDEATASLDEVTEARLYRLLAEKLPHTTLVSIGHRASLEPFHRRNMVLVPDGDHFRMQESAMAAAPAG